MNMFQALCQRNRDLYLNIYPYNLRSVSDMGRREAYIQKEFNILRPRQNGRHFPDDIFTCIFMNENVWILITILLKFVPGGLIDNILSLVTITAWHRAGDKPLSEAMMVSLLTHICVTQPQWVKPKLLFWCILFVLFITTDFRTFVESNTGIINWPPLSLKQNRLE